MDKLQKVTIVGNADPTHIGTHLHSAARALDIRCELLDVRESQRGPYILQKLLWSLAGHRPVSLLAFSAAVVQHCIDFRPTILVCTGQAPLTAADLQKIGELGILRTNYLTDDPWNPAHRAPWFMNTLRHYDRIFSPRRANLEDLQRYGCRGVTYLPFAYSPDTHFPDESLASGAAEAMDVVFVGAADSDRIPFARELIRAGVRVDLYGLYWGRFRQTRAHARGMASAGLMRSLASRAKVSLCLVRRANRDGHCMRTFELAAMGACILAEDTPEHREVFGDDGDAVCFFSGLAELVEKVQSLLHSDEQRARLRLRCYQRIVAGEHRYADRLKSMLRYLS